MRSPGTTATASDAHRIAELATPNVELVDVYASPRKVTSKQIFMALSPGPEKTKLYLDVAASLLDLGMSQTNVTPSSISQPDSVLGMWTTIQLPRRKLNGMAKAKRLDGSDILSGSLILPLPVFKQIFGPGHDANKAALDKWVLVQTIQRGECETTEEERALKLAVEILQSTPPQVCINSLVNELNAKQGDILVFSLPRASENILGSSQDPTPVAVQVISDLDLLTTTPQTWVATAAADDDDDDTTPDCTTTIATTTTSILANTSAQRRRIILPPKRYAALVSDMPSEGELSDKKQGGMSLPSKQQSKGRGRPRKLAMTVPASQPSQFSQPAARPLMTCAHCNTTETPRWWKDAFPKGTLCNACGIWLKRHGYPRPVQFFECAPVTNTNTNTSQEAFYLINGRPKRARSNFQTDQVQSKAEEGGGSGEGGEGGEGQGGGESDAGCDDELNDKSANTANIQHINFEAAENRVFVMKRKLLAVSIESDGEVKHSVAGVLVHVGWAPGARSAISMYERVISALSFIDFAPVMLNDFELLGETKAAITISAKATSPGLDTWDTIVTRLVSAL